MADRLSELERRKLLKGIGIAGIAGLAGCGGESQNQNTSGGSTTTAGGGGSGGTTTSSGGGGGDSTYLQAARDLNFGANWQERRMNPGDWGPSASDLPQTGSEGFSREAWRNSEPFQNGPWTPPEGFSDSMAADVDNIVHLNFGGLNYDPATVATQEMFRRETDIGVESLQMSNTSAVTRARAALASQEPEPTLIIQNNWSLSSFIANSFAEVQNPVMPDDAMWDPILPAAQDVWTSGLDPSASGTHLHAGPNILEGSCTHIRPDLLEEQGLDPTTYTEGEWDWDDLEAAMQAFEGTDVSAWAFYAGSGDPEYVNWGFSEMLYQQGATIVQDDGTVVYNSDPAMRALNRWKKWYDNGWVPSGVTGFTQGDLSSQFLSGQVAMVPVFTDLIGSALGQFEQGTEYTINIPPAATAGPNPGPAGVASTASLIINPYAPPAKKLAALTYVDARYSYESSWYEYVVEGNQAYVKDVYADAAGSKPFSEKLGRAINVCYAETFQAQQQIVQRFASEVSSALVGDKSVEQALNDTQSYVDTLLGQNVA